MKKAIKQSTLASLLNGGSILLAIAVAIAFFYLLQMTQQMDDANLDRYDLISNTNRFRNASAYLTNEVRAYSANGDQIYYDNYWNEVDTLKNRDIGVSNMKKIGLSPEEEQLIGTMAGISEGLIPIEEEAMALAKQEKWDDALALVYGETYKQQVNAMNGHMQELLNSIEERTSEHIQTCQQEILVIQFITGAAIVLIMLFQFITLFMIRFKIIRPIKLIRDEMLEFSKGLLGSEFTLEPDTSEIGQLVGAIHGSKEALSGYIEEIDLAMAAMANGNFDIQPGRKFLGDFEHIETSIQSFIVSISDTLNQINQAACQVASSASQVSDNAQDLAQGASEQASAIQELSASLSEVSAQAEKSTESSQKAADMSVGATTAVEACNVEMENLMTAMKEIKDKSGQIRHIISTIDDIAFQTNILALNAAVEAARAGEAGKGFAVVADEVRSLASKSAEAASNTAQLIEETVSAIDHSNALTQNAATGLREIVTGAQETTGLVSDVTSASQNQANAIGQIDTGIDQISHVITSNSATSEESAAASEELSRLAVLMQQQLSRFKTKATKPALMG